MGSREGESINLVELSVFTLLGYMEILRIVSYFNH